jgi:hypothetical protein
MRRRGRWYLAAATAVLLTLESIYFLWFGYALARLFRGARNVSPSDPLPEAVWTNAAIGVALVGFAVLYARSTAIRRWAFLPGIAAVLYGCWGAWSGYPLMASPWSAFEGDAIALGVLSGVGFAAIGVLMLLERLSSPIEH